MRELARIRALWLELGQALDAAEAEQPAPRVKQGRRGRALQLPATPSPRAKVAQVRQALRKAGVRA